MGTKSFILGQLLATTQIAECSILDNENGLPPISGTDFLQKPEMFFPFVERKAEVLQNRLRGTKQNSLLRELNEIYTQMRQEEDFLKCINQEEFTHGFEMQIRCSKFVWI